MIGPGSKTSGDLKAHVDCSNGVNDTTLLAACWNAQQSETADQEWSRIRSMIFRETCDTKPEQKMMNAAVQPTSSKYLCMVENPSTGSNSWGQHRSCDFLASTLIDVLLSKILERLSDPNLFCEELPRWVITTTKSVFEKVLEAFENLAQKQATAGKHHTNASQDINDLEADSMIYYYIFNVVATLICLHTLGVKEVSCSPLPMILCSSESYSIADVLVNLQRGMAVNPAMTTEFDSMTPLGSVLSTAIGISLLQILTGVNTPRRSRVTPMIVERHGFSIDDRDGKLKVSIVIGLPDEDDSISGSRVKQSDVQQRSTSRQDSSLFQTDCVAHLETNLDDISGESLAFAIEILLQYGAIDAWVTPIVMKKGRPAHTLHCLCKDNDDARNDNTTIEKILKLIFEHTSTLGIRIYRGVPRAKLERSMTTVTTPFINTSRKGRVDIKVSSFKNGQVVRKKAEFDHCKEIATEMGVGIQVVAGEAIKAYDNTSSET